MSETLPIEAVLPDLRRALARSGRVILCAPPGAGKTTGVPPALMGEDWLAGGRILLLEPRRLAARAAAQRMAGLLGEAVGGRVGYRIRNDTRVGPATRIEVVTEGVLTRLLLADPALEGVGAVVFDEFHERSLHADVGLALCLEAQALLRPELRLLVMSATLDTAGVAAVLEPAALVTAETRSWPVEVRWRDRELEGPVEPAVVRTVLEALDRERGDILVFLPGAAEIARVAASLDAAGPTGGVRVHRLHGTLPQAEQDRALAPAPPDGRKVVLATAIAETSLTIDGVAVVIDAGLSRVPRYSPRTGMTALETRPVTRASAEQRCGRAGRQGPGVCYRLWTRARHATLLERATPELLESDLAPLVLHLAVWGAHEPDALRWIDAPPAAAWSEARALLAALGAVDADGRVTPHGRDMAGLGVHPRLGHMLLAARARRLGGLACDLAALLEDRDPLRGDAALDPDVGLRLDALRGGGLPAADRATLQRARADARRLRRRLGIDGADGGVGDAAAGVLLAMAYPDRVGRRRTGRRGRFLLRGGRGAVLPEGSALAERPWIVAAHLLGHGRDSRVLLAAPIDEADVHALFGDAFETDDEVMLDADAGVVRARRVERLGAIVLRTRRIDRPDAGAVADAVLDELARRGPAILPWTRDAVRLRQRLAFLHRLEPAQWPDVADAALLASAGVWLRPFLLRLAAAPNLARIDLAAVLAALVPAGLRGRLDTLAPTHIVVPSGSRIAIDYGDPDSPVLAVRVQEMFGLAEGPRVGGGRVPLTLHLLSPAGRPAQITRDLAGFWRSGYHEVRRDLRGRYPKHAWPDDPLAAPAVRPGARRRG